MLHSHLQIIQSLLFSIPKKKSCTGDKLDCYHCGLLFCSISAWNISPLPKITSKGYSQILCVSKVRGNWSHWWIPLFREVLHYSTFCDASCHGSSWWSVEKKILMRTNSWVFQVLSFPSLLAMSLPPKRGVWRVADRAKGKSRGNLKGGKISPALEPDFSRNCIETQSKKLGLWYAIMDNWKLA